MVKRISKEDEYIAMLLSLNVLHRTALQLLASDEQGVYLCELDEEYWCPVRDAGLGAVARRAMCELLGCAYKARIEHVAEGLR